MHPQRTIPRVCQRCAGHFLAVAGEVNSGAALFCGRDCYLAFRQPGDVVIETDGSARVPLSGRNGEPRAWAVIDAADAAWAGQWAWQVNASGYVYRRTKIDGRRVTLKLHRELLGLVHGDGFDGDHRDRDRLNCRRSNLRVVNRGGNNQNKTPYRGSTSPYRGVYWHSAGKAWVAIVTIEGKRHYLGLFSDETEAARVAQEARKRLMPYAID